jgi:hypothetical protein
MVRPSDELGAPVIIQNCCFCLFLMKLKIQNSQWVLPVFSFSHSKLKIGRLDGDPGTELLYMVRPSDELGAPVIIQNCCFSLFLMKLKIQNSKLIIAAGLRLAAQFPSHPASLAHSHQAAMPFRAQFNFSL